MSLWEMAIVNGVLVLGLLIAVGYVCALPFRLGAFDDGPSPGSLLLRAGRARRPGPRRNGGRRRVVAAASAPAAGATGA